MYRPGSATPIHGPPPFGPPPPRCPPYRPRGPCGVPPPAHLPPAPYGTFSASAQGSHFLLNRPPAEHFLRPHCSTFSINDSTMTALGGSKQISPPVQQHHNQVPPWKPPPMDHQPPDSSEDAGEEFLRCIAANKPLPDYLKGNMAYNLADAFNSANVLKDILKSNPDFQKHATRSKSRSRSRGKSRAKSPTQSNSRAQSRVRNKSRERAKSRARSRARSRSSARSRSRSRARSRARGRVRSRSRARSKSRVRGMARSKSRPRSRSLSRSKKKSRGRSKSRARRSRSRGSSSEKSHGKDSKRKSFSNNNTLTGKSLLEGLKLVMKSKALEERLPALKDAILTIQVQSKENSAVLKADVLEDEESFLYGNKDTGGKEAKNLPQIEELAKPQEMAHSGSEHHQNKSRFSTFGGPLDLKAHQMTSPCVASAKLDSIECEKIRNILESLGKADVNEIMVTMQGLKEGKQLSPAFPAAALALPALSNPNVRHALESLQSLIKVTKERREKSDASVTSQTFSDRYKAGTNEETRNKKQARISQMESLMKELEGLLKQDGLSFLSPVIGFYCHKCEEFIGDLNSAENHAAIHCHSNFSTKLPKDKPAEDIKGTRHFSNSTEQPHPSDRMAYHMDHSDHRDHHRGWRDERDQQSKGSRSQGAEQNSSSLKEEMRSERMLITVSRGLTPPPHARVEEQMNHGPNVESCSKVKVEEKDRRGKPRKDKRAKDESSDRGKKHIGKSPKKKKEKKKKKS
ncbi:uncharacterized protein AB9W97_019342 isoform 2-T2 [Spinachia spinachia]